MGQDLGVVEIVHWMTYVFPSLSEYTKIIMPLLIFAISAIGVFSNVLPEPGTLYPVPQSEDLAAELHDKGWFVYRLTLLSRKLTILANKVVASKPYAWFHRFTEICSNLLSRVRGESLKSEDVKITIPKPHVIDMGIKEDPDSDQEMHNP